MLFIFERHIYFENGKNKGNLMRQSENKLAEQNVEAENVCEFQDKTGDLSQSSLDPKGQQNLSCYLGL